MVSFDLVVRGGRILTHSGILEAQICITDGKITAIEKGNVDSSHTIDARGSLVLPGLIDPHVHFRDPGLTHKEDFTSGSMGAAAGGVTSVFDMPNTAPPVTDSSRFKEKLEAIRSKSVVDYGVIAAAGPGNLTKIRELAQAGAVAFKTYTISPTGVNREEYGGWCATDSGQLLLTMQEVKKTGLVHCIHAESDSSVACLTHELHEEGRKDPMAHYDSRPNFAEEEAVSDALIIANVTKSKLHIVHLSASESLDLLASAKSRGVNASAETCPQYLYFTKEILNERGPYGKYNPPSRNSEDPQALINGLSAGVIDMVATDHAPHTKDEKETGWKDIFSAPPGTPGVETRLPLLLTLASRGALNLFLIPALTSEAVAKRFGLYPRKGSLNVGSDADLTIVDYDEEWVIKAAKLQTKAWECVLYDGMKVKGKVKYTLLGGQVVFEEGAGFAKPGSGKLIQGNPE
ncbi:MAG: allantoinase AllB [Nitrososphaerales archaeon]